MTAPETGHHPLDLRAYLGVVERRWRLVVVVVLVAVGLSLAVSLSQQKQYRSEAEVLLSQRSTESMLGVDGNAFAQYVNASRSLINEARALESGLVRDAVEQQYDGDLDPRDITVSNTAATTDVVEVSLTGPDPQEVADLVNLYVEVYIDVRRQQRVDDLLSAATEIQARVDDLTARITEVRGPLAGIEAQLAQDPTDASLLRQREDIIDALTPLEAQQATFQQQLQNLQVLSGVIESGGAQLLTRAEPAEEPSEPQPVRLGIIAGVIGLLLGMVGAFVRDSLDERIRTIEDVQLAAPGIPILAVVPTMPAEEAASIVVGDDIASVTGEAFRTLRTSVMFAGLDRRIRVVQVTSATTGEGKTLTAANLAASFHHGGEACVVVDSDFRRPRLHELFDVDVAPGFTDALLQRTRLDDAVRVGPAGVRVLTAGTAPPNPSELLSSSEASAIVEALAEQNSVVVIDSCPVLPVADALVVSRLVDATLVVVDLRRTKRKTVRQAMAMLDQVGAPVIGLVLNGASPGDRFGYGSEYRAGLERAERRKERRRAPVATP